MLRFQLSVYYLLVFNDYGKPAHGHSLQRQLPCQSHLYMLLSWLLRLPDVVWERIVSMHASTPKALNATIARIA
jgi:hypothetical protein